MIAHIANQRLVNSARLHIVSPKSCLPILLIQIKLDTLIVIHSLLLYCLGLGLVDEVVFYQISLC